MTETGPGVQAPSPDATTAAHTAHPTAHSEAGLRERKKQATRQALRRAALTLAVERGPEHVTVEEIAAAADVSPRTFFNYFASKDDVLVGEQADRFADLRALLLSRPADEPPVVALGEAVAEYISGMELDREIWTLRRRLVERHPGMLPRVLGANATAERSLAGLIAERTGLPADHAYPGLVAAVAIGAVRAAMLRAACHEPDRPPADVVRETFAALAGGLPQPATT